jgi:serine/threonine-protein kinase
VGSVEESVVVNDGLPRAGDIIADKFRVKRVLGRGGMGVVVAVDHLQLHEPYAMKFLLPHALQSDETVERFLREARAAVRIKSEHVARVADVGQLPDDVPYLLMEYLEGTDLADRLAQGPLPIPEAVEYVLQACAGIAEAHALGIIHRDLKPSNLFLTRRSDGAPLIKVLDFGIAKAIDRGEGAASLTATQAVFGTPAYMSPEQIRSAKNVDFRTDIWSLGVILYELVTGALPFPGESAAALLAAISADEPIPLRERRPAAPPELEAAIARSLAKDRKNRFATIAEMAYALAPFAGPNSVVNVERIMRLASPSERAVSVPPALAISSRSGSAGTAATIAAGSARAPDSRKLLFLIAPVVVIAIAATVIVTRKLSAEPQHQVIPEPSVSVPAPIVTPALPAVAATPIPTVVDPLPAATPMRPTTSPKKRPQPAVSAAPPAPAPAPAPAPVARPDPTGDSH